MKFLNKMKSDSKAIIRSLQNMNESLLNTLVDYQDVIYEKTEVIDSLHDVIKGMTDEEKVGQLFFVRYEYWDVKDQIKNYYPGGYVLFAKDFQDHTKTTIKSELDAHQKLSKIPLTFANPDDYDQLTTDQKLVLVGVFDGLKSAPRGQFPRFCL